MKLVKKKYNPLTAKDNTYIVLFKESLTYHNNPTYCYEFKNKLTAHGVYCKMKKDITIIGHIGFKVVKIKDNIPMLFNVN